MKIHPSLEGVGKSVNDGTCISINRDSVEIQLRFIEDYSLLKFPDTRQYGETRSSAVAFRHL